MKLQRRRQHPQNRTRRTAHTGPASQRHVTEHVHMNVNVNAENAWPKVCLLDSGGQKLAGGNPSANIQSATTGYLPREGTADPASPPVKKQQTPQ